MLKRVASGIAVSAVVLLVFFACGPWPCIAFALALFYFAQDELRLLAGAAGLPTEDVAVPVLGFAYLLAAGLESQCLRARCWGGAPPWWLPSSEAVAVVAPLVFLAVGVLRRKPEKGLERFAVAFASFWYAAILLGFLVKVALRFDSFDYGKWLLVYGLFVMKMNDTGAYFIGMKFGRNGRRLIPEISPAKSVAGLFGGMASLTLFSPPPFSWAWKPLYPLAWTWNPLISLCGMALVVLAVDAARDAARRIRGRGSDG